MTGFLIPAAAGFAALCFGLALICNLWCIRRAESVPDQILALDTMTANAVALIVLIGIIAGVPYVFEVALIFAMTGFIGTVSYGRYLLRGSVIE